MNGQIYLITYSTLLSDIPFIYVSIRLKCINIMITIYKMRQQLKFVNICIKK